MRKEWLTPQPGTYALILRCRATASVRIGRWGTLDLGPGYFVYVGSAFGPGGIRARVGRHYRRTKRRHWHIDYLREAVSFVHAWISYEPANQEHIWAAAFAAASGFSPVKGFGCSDCRCMSHLYTTDVMPDIGTLSASACANVASWPGTANARCASPVA